MAFSKSWLKVRDDAPAAILKLNQCRKEPRKWGSNCRSWSRTVRPSTSVKRWSILAASASLLRKIRNNWKGSRLITRKWLCNQRESDERSVVLDSEECRDS
ncbi:hypothetical protein CONCODRAFT_12377 [Conidiobolus coronatus NRRL 28638]|uniref:Uncharacterized protein n=1 Tax=Conidiobolus coronatus (strain ATCC 28846 / CBS 209.66 / NRRL 28638) TaxID=796925 RepID=A0A137NT54_CONC2|nr:hypothetical protein CONCODRAFT_12377 [Conidiobolus coronatus NRRL 28638]|eukprot:KXN65916.1 hypothetical protein CONCODRAFT_12377 [Conidiobolus coronatus NRRL 28638]